MFSMYFLGGIRWKYLYPEYSLKISTDAVVIAIAANALIPIRGGEIVRAFFLSKHSGGKISAILGKVLIERTTDMLSILSLLSISGAVLGEIIKKESIHIILFGLVAVSLIYSFLFVYKNYHEKIDKYLNFLLSKNKILTIIKEKLLIMLTPFKNMQLSRIIVAQIMSFGIVLFGILLLYFSLLSVNISADLSSIAVIFPLVVLSISLPISVAHVGVYHGAMILSLSYIQINDINLVGKVIVVHLLSIVPPILYGVILLSLANLNFFKASNKTESSQLLSKFNSRD